MNKEKLINFFRELSYKKWINFLFPASSTIVLILMGMLMMQATTNGKPIIFSEWLIIMSIFFIVFILPYNAIRWIAWGKRKYARKIIKKYNISCKNNTIAQKVLSANRLEYVDLCAQKIIQESELDSLFFKAGRFVLENNKASIGMLQRLLKISFNKSARIMDQLAKTGIVGKEQGTKPREILVNMQEYEMILKKLESYYESRLTEYHVNENTPNINYDSMTGPQFESFCSFLLISNGFKHVEVTKTSGDHGIDILAEKDDITYAIQCKCYSNNVGNDAVQQALAGKQFYKSDIAVVLTNQYFTPQAKEEATIFGVKLWDRDKLNELIQNLNN